MDQANPNQVPPSPATTDVAIFQHLANPEKADITQTPHTVVSVGRRTEFTSAAAAAAPFAQQNHGVYEQAGNSIANAPPEQFRFTQSARDAPATTDLFSNFPGIVGGGGGGTRSNAGPGGNRFSQRVQQRLARGTSSVANLQMQGLRGSRPPSVVSRRGMPTPDPLSFAQHQREEPALDIFCGDYEPEMPRSSGHEFPAMMADPIAGAESRVNAPEPEMPFSENDENVRREKQTTLIELYKLESQGVVLSRKFNMQDPLFDMKFELEKQRDCLDTNNAIFLFRESLRMILPTLEAVNKRFGPFLQIDGWSSRVCEDMTKYNHALERLYRKFWRKSQPSPIIELGWLIIGSMLMYHFQAKFSQFASKGTTGAHGRGDETSNNGGNNSQARGPEPEPSHVSHAAADTPQNLTPPMFGTGQWFQQANIQVPPPQQQQPAYAPQTPPYYPQQSQQQPQPQYQHQQYQPQSQTQNGNPLAAPVTRNALAQARTPQGGSSRPTLRPPSAKVRGARVSEPLQAQPQAHLQAQPPQAPHYSSQSQVSQTLPAGPSDSLSSRNDEIRPERPFDSSNENVSPGELRQFLRAIPRQDEEYTLSEDEEVPGASSAADEDGFDLSQLSNEELLELQRMLEDQSGDGDDDRVPRNSDAMSIVLPPQSVVGVHG